MDPENDRLINQMIQEKKEAVSLLEKFVLERNQALFSMARKKIEDFLSRWGEDPGRDLSDTVFWGGVCKAICNITAAPPEIYQKAVVWLMEHDMSPSMKLEEQDGNRRPV